MEYGYKNYHCVSRRIEDYGTFGFDKRLKDVYENLKYSFWYGDLERFEDKNWKNPVDYINEWGNWHSEDRKYITKETIVKVGNSIRFRVVSHKISGNDYHDTILIYETYLEYLVADYWNLFANGTFQMSGKDTLKMNSEILFQHYLKATGKNCLEVFGEIAEKISGKNFDAGQADIQEKTGDFFRDVLKIC
jgi:hypothetical protein